MAIAIRGSTPGTTTVSGTAALSLALTGTRQPNAGDVLLIIYSNDYYVATNLPTPTVAGSTSGVTAVTSGASDMGTNQPHIKSYTYVVGSTADRTVAATETGSTDDEKALVVYVLSGVDTTTPVDAAAGGGSTTASTSNVAPAVSPTTSDAFLVCHVQKDGTHQAGSYTPPSGMTEQFDIAISTFSVVSGATLQLSASGTTGTKTFTSSNSTGSATLSVAMRSSSGGGPTIRRRIGKRTY